MTDPEEKGLFRNFIVSSFTRPNLARTLTETRSVEGLCIAILWTVPHFFYLARCADHALYAGTCVDIEDREQKHNDGKGAKYTRSRRPVKIIYFETFQTLSEARKREAEVKKWKKGEKEALVKRSIRRRISSLHTGRA